MEEPHPPRSVSCVPSDLVDVCFLDVADRGDDFGEGGRTSADLNLEDRSIVLSENLESRRIHHQQE